MIEEVNNNIEDMKLTYPKTINYMNGISYELNEILTLRMVAASYIRGEKLYYKSSEEGKIMFDNALKNALDTNFEKVIDLAIELREKYNMRLNPQILIMAASIHPKRKEFCEQNPKVLKNAINQVSKIPTDILTQFEYYLEINKNKNKLPGIVKRAWAEYFEKLEKYQAAKYLNKGKLKNLIKICHPNPNKNEIINEIIKTGKVEIDTTMKTWENLRSAGKNWFEIFSELKTLPHMALLRNLCGIEKDPSIETDYLINNIIPMLKNGVKNGKQFPFQYYNAYKSLKNTHHGEKTNLLIKAVEDCLQLSIENFPYLKGKTISLCDNSGSAHGTLATEYGSVKISEIANLSGLITAMRSENGGKVGIFGDKLNYYDVNKNRPILEQLDEINKLGIQIGQSTENGIWIHFRISCMTKEHYDNIFIYSDMQAGHGNLYGIDPKEYKDFIANNKGGSYIDVMKLIETYRELVYPKTNVFSVQVAGYNNSLTPENSYRTSIMQGWTGKEVLYASELINIWNQSEQINKN